MKFKKKLENDKMEQKKKINLIIDSLNSIKESKNFENILKMILFMGNYLNTDMAKGNALGININVINMLENVKSNTEEKYTLLEVLVINIRTKEKNLMNFYKDFSDFDQVLMVIFLFFKISVGYK